MYLNLFSTAEKLFSALRDAECSVTFRADALMRTAYEEETLQTKSVRLSAYRPEDFGLVYNARPKYMWERACAEKLLPCQTLTAPFLFLHHKKLLSKDENLYVVSKKGGEIFCMNILYCMGAWQICEMGFEEPQRRVTLKNKFVFAMP